MVPMGGSDTWGMGGLFKNKTLIEMMSCCYSMQSAIPRDQVIVGHTPTQKRDMTGNKIQSLWSIIIKALMTSQPIVLDLIIYIETLRFYAC